MNNRNVTVNLGDRSYPIIIEQSLLGGVDCSPYVRGHQVCIVSNSHIAELYLPAVEQLFSNYEVCCCFIGDGESFKSLESAQKVFDVLIQKQFSRQCTIVALGGGVVGDLAGFVAATWMRGVSFIQIPTTLLAQVDSSVGGKTAVNHARGKNMIGAFHQPTAVLADISTLATLSDRQLRAGLAEVIKYGLITDRKFFDWIESNIEALLNRDAGALGFAIQRSCEIKASIVAQDEREQNVRALLNLGHTFGHAIEAHTGYSSWLHGEAISAGMVMACDLSRLLGHISASDLQRITSLFVHAGLPVKGPQSMGVSHYLEKMSNDKKVINNCIRLILLQSIGQAFVSNDYPDELLRKTIEDNTATQGNTL